MNGNQEVMNRLLKSLVGQDVIITYGLPEWKEEITVKGILTNQSDEWIVAVKITNLNEKWPKTCRTIWIDAKYIVSVESRNSEIPSKYEPKIGDKIVVKNLYRMKDPIGKEVPFYTTLEIVSFEDNYYAVQFRNELGRWTERKILVEELKALDEWGCIEIKERGDEE